MEIKCKVDIDDVIRAIDTDPDIWKWFDEDKGLKMIESVLSRCYSSVFVEKVKEMMVP